MPETKKKRDPSLRERRKLLRQFRKQIGVTLSKFAKSAQLSKGMVSLFENGGRDLSAEAWARVLEAMSKLVQGEGNVRWPPDKRFAGIAKAQETASKLGAAISQSLHSPTFSERLQTYALIDEPTELEEALEQRRELLEMACQMDHSLIASRKENEFWRTFADKYDAMRDVLGLRDKKILAEEAEQQKVDELGLEQIPSPEFDALREEIADRGRKEKTKP